MSYLAGLQKVLYEFDDRTTVFNNLATFSDIMGTNINDVTSYELYDIIDGARPDQVSLELYNTPLYHWTLFLLNDHIRGGNWPLSYLELSAYILKKYPNKSILVTADISGSFIIGTSVVGQTSGALGTVISKDTNMGKMTIRVIAGVFQDAEDIIDSAADPAVPITISSIMSEHLAPHHYEDTSGITDINPYTQVTPSGVSIVTNWDYEYNKNNDLGRIRVIKKSHISKVVAN
jgi:hypothetical protein|tara:strand:+ start:1020 stop:1718 length:699 start_codon:yes stop_codon:yes gene_type:complete